MNRFNEPIKEVILFFFMVTLFIGGIRTRILKDGDEKFICTTLKTNTLFGRAGMPVGNLSTGKIKRSYEYVTNKK